MNRRHRRSGAGRVAAVAVVVATCLAPRARAENAVVNPYFDTGTTGWTGSGLFGGSGSVTFLAGSGSHQPGAAQVTLSPAGDADDEFEIRQCFSLVGVASPYDWGGRFRIVSMQVAVPAVRITAFDLPGCVGGVLFEQSALPDGTVPGVPGDFQLRSTIGTTLPFGAVSVRIAGAVIGFDLGATGTAIFDSFFFGPPGTIDLLFEDGFESGNTSAWS